MHSLPPSIVPVFIATFVAPLTIWSGLFAAFAAQRANGRRAVEAELKRLGETAVTVEHVPFYKLADRAGLSRGVVFRVVARTADGATTTHLWAYEPGLITLRGPGGLKRLSHGIWIPA